MTNPHAGTGLPSFPSGSELGGATYRRPSYATVAAGTNASSDSARSNAFVAPSAEGDEHQQQQQQQQPSPAPGATGRHSRQGSRSMETEGPGSHRSWKRPGEMWSGDHRPGCPQHDPHPSFFTPSYLRQSRHVQRLYRAHCERLAELRESGRAQHAKAPPLSASSSNANLNKMHASHVHRPAVQDVIERLPPAADEDRAHPLPTRWSDDDKMNGLEILAEGTEARFGGVMKTSDEAASIRADHAMPKECGLYYFEVTVLSKPKDGPIGIGFSAKRAMLNRLPGWETDSWAYHGDDGYSFACTASGKAYGPRFSREDVVGCGVNFRTGSAFFTKNGVYLGVAFTGIKGDQLYPSVGMKKTGEHVRVNFGRTPFVFDIDRMMAQERQAIRAEIRSFDVTSLHSPDDENTLVHKLIGQYLAHEGYVETAKAFAQDVHEQQQSLSSDPLPFQLPNSGDDIHAINRQKIRRSILDGDIDRALKYTTSYYPRVLDEDRNKDIYFRLKCRKFIEMMRRYTELAVPTPAPDPNSPTGLPVSNGHSGGVATDQGADEGGDQSDTQMELDDQLHREASRGLEPTTPSEDVDMEASQELPPRPAFMKEGNLPSAALAYGQELQREFGGDPRQQVKKQLQDLFAIIAYADPAESPIGPLLHPQGRVQIAEEVNGAILVSLGKPSSAALEKLCAQTEALLDETAAKTGGGAAFVDVRRDFLQA